MEFEHSEYELVKILNDRINNALFMSKESEDTIEHIDMKYSDFKQLLQDFCLIHFKAGFKSGKRK